MGLNLTIPMQLPSANNLREHWRVRHRRVKAQRQTVAWFLTASTPRPALPVVVTLTRVGVRDLDGDNLQGAFKAVRDQVATWLGLDDADPRIRWEYDQRRGKVCAVEIRVESA